MFYYGVMRYLMLITQTPSDYEKFKVLTVVGTRPEIIVIKYNKSLDKKINHVLVHTGQNYDYELGKIFFKDLLLRYPDYQINLIMIILLIKFQ